MQYNAGQYYPDYAFNHPLFTNKMRIYSDTKVSRFINSITRDLICTMKFDITGIFIGISIAMIATKFLVGLYVLYKREFGKSVACYFCRIGIYIGIGIIGAVITHIINSLLSDSGMVPFIGRMCTCVLGPN